RRAGDLPPEARGDGLDLDLRRVELLRDRILERAGLRPVQRAQAQLEALVLIAAYSHAANLVVSVRTDDSEVGCGVVNETCVPPLKSIPRLRPFTASAPIEITTIAPEIANQR